MKSSCSFPFRPVVLCLSVLCLGFVTFAQTLPTDGKTGITTIYARDPLAKSLCFRDGADGGIFYQNEVRNRCSDINFNSYSADKFTVGVEGGREGVILNIGSPAELQKKYGYAETVGNGQGFASLQVKDRKVQILRDRRTRTTQELADTDQLFQKPSSDAETVAVKLGDVYLMRLTDTHDKAFELIVKILVVAHVPNEYVTIRWVVM